MQDFSTIIQIGIIVPDAQAVTSQLKRFLGWETQQSRETSRVSGRIYHGQPADFACRMDFFQLPGMELEIIQPLKGPSCWQDYLDENGYGIHHLLFDVSDSACSFAALHAYGIEIEQQGRALPFGDHVFWAYVESARTLGFTMELTNRREYPKLMSRTPPIQGSYANLLGVSIAVHNLDQTIRNWAHILGWHTEGQPYRIYGEHYQDAESNALSGAVSYRLPNLQVELVRPACGMSCARDYLAAHGEGICCLTIALENREALVALTEAGITILERGHTLRHDQLSRWAILDTRSIFGFYLKVVYP